MPRRLAVRRSRRPFADRTLCRAFVFSMDVYDAGMGVMSVFYSDTNF